MRTLRFAILALAVLFLCAASPVVDALRAQREVEQRMLEQSLDELEAAFNEQREVGDRVDRLSADLLQAQRDGADADELNARDQDLRSAEAILIASTQRSQQLRQSLSQTTNRLGIIETRIRELAGTSDRPTDPISGRWQVVIEPGGQNGIWTLDLQGTLISGTYALDGSWNGSLRGTLVAGRLRLERIDAQQGFNAIYYGRLDRPGEEMRLVGTWESTNLSAGRASSGSWVAVKIIDSDDGI